MQTWKIKKDALDRSCFTFRLHSCPIFSKRIETFPSFSVWECLTKQDEGECGITWRVFLLLVCIRLYRYRYINLISLYRILLRNFHHQDLFSLNLDLVYGGIRCHSFEKRWKHYSSKKCEVSQIRSSTLNCLVVKESILKTATETLLLHSSLTTNNSWPLLFSKQTINTETHISGGHVVIDVSTVAFPIKWWEGGTPFYKGNFRAPTPLHSHPEWESTGALTLKKHESLSRSSNMDRQHEPIRHHSFEAGITANISKLPRQCKPGR